MSKKQSAVGFRQKSNVVLDTQQRDVSCFLLPTWPSFAAESTQAGDPSVHSRSVTRQLPKVIAPEHNDTVS